MEECDDSILQPTLFPPWLWQVKEETFMFGVSSDKSEAAKALLYPQPSEADMAEESRRSGPGEQRRRGYSWNVDIENHRFGRPGSLEAPLCLDDGGEPPSRLVSKKLDDFRETQDAIGRAKNLGHSNRDHLGKVDRNSVSSVHVPFVSRLFQ